MTGEETLGDVADSGGVRRSGEGAHVVKRLGRTVVGTVAVLAVAIGGGQTVAGAQPPGALDILVGRWTLHDAKGAPVGESHVRVLEAGVMLFEERTIGSAKPQPLWFANFESQGWQQLFVGVQGNLRSFATESPVGAWPIVMGATVATRDGQVTRFRMTMSRASDDEMRRVLESSRDAGSTWTPVFDYTYRRRSR